MSFDTQRQEQPAVLNRTPRRSDALPQRLGGFQTIADGLDYAAKGVTGFNFYGGRGALAEVLPFADLRRRALSTARKLLSLGLKRGDRVAVVAETGGEFMAVFFGCQYAGLVPCPVPYSMYIGGRDAYIERVAGMFRAADVSAVITSEDVKEHIREGAALANVSVVFSHAELNACPESLTRLEGFGPDDVAYIQYSSGSTSSPKGVLIMQRSIMANADGILRNGLKVREGDRAFSWLPLYHDMGLVGFCLAPMLGQVTVDYLPTTAFARRPSLWLKLMSENRSTVSYSPTFGYELACRRVNGEAITLDLSQWRAAGIGGDMVRAEVLQDFAKTLSLAGFNPRAFVPSYGMAESTLAISFSDVDAPIKIDTIDIGALKTRKRAIPAKAGTERTRSFVICGAALPEHVIEVRGDNGGVLDERDVGRIYVKGPSIMAGYYKAEEATAQALGSDGFLDTGDMGYLLNGEIVITGRAKDLILHNGRNIWPQDIEWAAETIAPLKSGDVAAFAIEGSDGDDEVVVLVECKLSDPLQQEELRKSVHMKVMQAAGVDCTIILAPPRSLPFTSSGKLSRAGARDRYLAGEIAEIAPDQGRA
ncbi:MAG: fatty acyl-AMP ligase [Rhizobiales bacterium]|nr:fatty acyl-AMP ligase [Hyphomicrobiales bacterium]